MTRAQRINTALRRVPSWPLYLLGAIPAVWLLAQALTGGLGPDPVKALERQLGEIALQLLVAGLAITPVLRLTRVNLIRYRRALGLLAFIYAALHLTVWLVLDVQIPAQIWADIVKRPYVTIGMTAFVLMIPLALTSNAWSIRKLGPAWRRLHKLTYAVALMGGVHYLMLVKGWQIEPMLYLAGIAALLLMRLRVSAALGATAARARSV
ncbi:MAG: protein-methionine-sulfoxide reductase heme-binding subunit MsrQ [Roseivivax sp.]|nr:protein-methionine-sulfoxide reductase heme-binding subunit MsrQ [Roseivivax sp.]